MNNLCEILHLGSPRSPGARGKASVWNGQGFCGEVDLYDAGYVSTFWGQEAGSCLNLRGSLIGQWRNPCSVDLCVDMIYLFYFHIFV